MTETMKVTEALDERDFLKKKILKDLEQLRGSVYTAKRKMDPLTKNKNTVEEYEANAKSTYDSITSQINRFNKICMAIVQSNAETKINVGGTEMTVARAIELRKQLRGSGNLETTLIAILEDAYASEERAYDRLRADYNDKRGEIERGILAGSAAGNRKLSEEEVDLVDKMSEKYTVEIIDPLNIKELISSEKDKYNKLIKDIDMAIKISNATTDLTF